MKLYEVGGAVRDALLGVETKDVDFVVIAESFAAMCAELTADGFGIYITNPEFVTARVSVPADHPLYARTKNADFVLARKDGPSSDGRHPDFVEPGTLLDDLARRDFTVNAMARDPLSGELIDPHHGEQDLGLRLLRFVGDPMQRIREDGLRVLRAFRFIITKGLHPCIETNKALRTPEAARMLQCVSIERVREELERMLRHDTRATLALLMDQPPLTLDAIFRDGLRLGATLKQ